MFDYPQGEETADALYLQVGRALSAFEAIEFLLSGLMACALDGNDTVTHAVWQSLKTVNTRIDALRAALSVSSATCLEAAGKPAIDNAIKDAFAVMALRNNLAHGVVTETSRDGSKSYLFFPSSAKKGNSPFEPAFCYTAADIAEIDAQIDEVAKKMARTFRPIFEARMEEHRQRFLQQSHEQ